MQRDTVAVDTLAALATSISVAGVLGFIFLVILIVPTGFKLVLQCENVKACIALV